MSTAVKNDLVLSITVDQPSLRMSQTEMRRAATSINQAFENTRIKAKSTGVALWKVFDAVRAVADEASRLGAGVSGAKKQNAVTMVPTKGGAPVSQFFTDPRGAIVDTWVTRSTGPEKAAAIFRRTEEELRDHLSAINARHGQTDYGKALYQELQGMVRQIKKTKMEKEEKEANAKIKDFSEQIVNLFQGPTLLHGLTLSDETFRGISNRFNQAWRRYQGEESDLTEFVQELTIIKTTLEGVKPGPLVWATGALAKEFPMTAGFRRIVEDVDELSRLKELFNSLLTVLSGLDQNGEDSANWADQVKGLMDALAAPGTADAVGNTLGQTGELVEQAAKLWAELLSSNSSENLLEFLIPSGLAEAAEAELGRTGGGLPTACRKCGRGGAGHCILLGSGRPVGRSRPSGGADRLLPRTARGHARGRGRIRAAPPAHGGPAGGTV